MSEADRAVTDAGDCLSEELVFLGSDVCSLFPWCMARMAGDMVRRAVLETDIQFEGVDFKEFGKYVAMNCSTWEISQAGLSRWVPVRAKQRGAKPGVTGAGVMGPTKEVNNSMWKFTRFLLTPEAKKRLLAKGLEVAVKVMYNTHLHIWWQGVPPEVGRPHRRTRVGGHLQDHPELP